jgi:hydroxyacylglutathione hydrolase
MPPVPAAEVPGSFPARWIHGSPNCATNADPPFQVHWYEEDTAILRQNKCAHFEAPFLYLLFGSDQALLLDTAAIPAVGPFPLRQTVDSLVGEWLAGRGLPALPLIVGHTHSHGDHIGGDAQFASRPQTTVVKPTLDAVKTFFGITGWPDQIATLNLGARAFRVIATPGHDETAIAVYDPRTHILFTGDTFYPGRLFIEDWNAFKASIARLVTFCESNPVTHILGNHIEMTDQPGVEYPVGTTFQPSERALSLKRTHLIELHEAAQRLGAVPVREIHDDFIIDP